MSRATGLAALVAFAGVLVAGIILRPLTPVDETRYVAVAWEMWLRGDYFVPTKNFAVYSHKPPLLFWLINLAWAVTGVSETAARLVGPASGGLAVILTGVLARRLWPGDAGAFWRAVAALSGTSLFVVSAGLTMFDALLTACVVGAMIALVSAVETGRWRWFTALGACVAAGVLAKGPVVLLFVLPAALAVRFWDVAGDDETRQRNGELLRGAAVSLAAALAIVALWLGPALVLGDPQYREAILWRQTAGRMVSSFAHARPWWFFLALLPVVVFPWGWQPALWRAARRTCWRDRGLRLALVWGGGAVVLFSLISGKQVHYMVPVLPAVALVAARLTRDVRAPGVGMAAVPPLLIAAGGALVALGVIPLGDELAPLFEPRIALLPWMALLAVLSLGALRLGALSGGAVVGLATVLVVNLVIGTTRLHDVYDTTGIAQAVAGVQGDGIAFVGAYHAQFNFAARLTRPVTRLGDAREVRAWVAAHPGGVVVGKRGQVPLSHPPRKTVLFRGSPYGIWNATPTGNDKEGG